MLLLTVCSMIFIIMKCKKKSWKNILMDFKHSTLCDCHSRQNSVIKVHNDGSSYQTSFNHSVCFCQANVILKIIMCLHTCTLI